MPPPVLSSRRASTTPPLDADDASSQSSNTPVDARPLTNHPNSAVNVVTIHGTAALSPSDHTALRGSDAERRLLAQECGDWIGLCNLTDMHKIPLERLGYAWHRANLPASKLLDLAVALEHSSASEVLLMLKELHGKLQMPAWIDKVPMGWLSQMLDFLPATLQLRLMHASRTLQGRVSQIGQYPKPMAVLVRWGNLLAPFRPEVRHRAIASDIDAGRRATFALVMKGGPDGFDLQATLELARLYAPEAYDDYVKLKRIVETRTESFWWEFEDCRTVMHHSPFDKISWSLRGSEWLRVYAFAKLGSALARANASSAGAPRQGLAEAVARYEQINQRMQKLVAEQAAHASSIPSLPPGLKTIGEYEREKESVRTAASDEIIPLLEAGLEPNFGRALRQLDDCIRRIADQCESDPSKIDGKKLAEDLHSISKDFAIMSSGLISVAAHLAGSAAADKGESLLNALNAIREHLVRNAASRFIEKQGLGKPAPH